MTTQPITSNPDILILQPRLQDSDASTRRIALIELADLEDLDALPWLTHALTTDTDNEVRREAARLLEGWEEPEVVEALAAALTDTDETVGEIAAQSLSQLKTTDLGHIILRWVKHPTADVRKHAWRALRELRLPASAPDAITALHDANANVRREAVGVLGWLKHIDALPELARLASNDSAIEVRRAATGALGLANNDSVLPALHSALTDAEWQVREEAASTLGKLRLPASGNYLVTALADSYWQVRLQAVRALGKLRFVPATESLLELLTHSISNLRKETALALGELGNPKSLPALRDAENDPDPEVRKAVRIALAQLQK